MEQVTRAVAVCETLDYVCSIATVTNTIIKLNPHLDTFQKGNERNHE